MEAALAAPSASFGGREFYATLPEKAASLLYALAKGHACPNGNKRLASVLTLEFLQRNGYFVWVESNALAEQVLEVAASVSADAEAVRTAAAHWIEAHMIPLLEAIVRIHAGISPERSRQ